MNMHIIRTVTVLVALLAGFASSQARAGGGSWLEGVHDRYEPGDVVTMVGYAGSPSHGVGFGGTIDDGPYGAYLRVDPGAAEAGFDQGRSWPFVLESDIRLGEITLEPTDHTGYLAYRASITFTLPSDLEPGNYEVVYCNPGCSVVFRDLFGGWLYVGMDPEWDQSYREWALDEPEIANLDATVMIAGPFDPIPAWQLRDGHVRAGVMPLFGARPR